MSQALIGAIILLAVSAFSHAASSHDIGIRSSSAIVAERGEAIGLTIWYPAKPDGAPESIGSSKIFKGVPGRRDASAADGAYRVVLLTHGGLRANPEMAGWIAADLAARGYLVVVTQQPKPSPGDAAVAVREIWLRPADLSAALSAVIADPVLGSHIADKKIAAVGFFLGGTSVLAVAGARLDAENYRRSCDDPTAGPDCRWFAKSHVDLHAVDAKLVSASHRDPRVSLAVAIDPELVGSFSPDSLAKIDVPIHVISLGPADSAPPALNVIPALRYQTIPDATPFSAFSECTPQAEAILREEGEDETICSDRGHRPRADIHAEIGRMIAEVLASGFGGEP